MKTTFPLSREGYVTTYMTTVPSLEDFKAPYALNDQLKFEKEMRDIFYTEPISSADTAGLGEISSIGTPWTFYAQNKNTYIDYSFFYHTLKRVTILAKTVLVSDKARTVRARVWSYAAFDMWLRGEKIATEKVPVYQPIRHTDSTLSLDEGENDLFIYIQNFGVRDTRNMLAIQLFDTDGICATLPIEDGTLSKLAYAQEWFSSLKIEENTIYAIGEVPQCVCVKLGKEEKFWCDEKSFDIGNAFNFTVTCEICGQTFSRKFERYEMTKPPKSEHKCKDIFTENAHNVLKKLTKSIDSTENVYRNIQSHLRCYVALCRIALDESHAITECDKRAIRDALVNIHERADCADFALSCLLRMMIQLNLPDDIREEIRQASLEFRYWMDEDGADAMCFWSENHSLLFYGCQAIAGKLYPSDRFMRSGRSGKEQEKIGLRRLGEWFDVVEQDGFEEFLAGGYLGVTLAALLMVYDFCPTLKNRAKAVMDRIIKETATQCFDGIHLAPMGRIYRGALTPYDSTLQAMLYLIDDKNAYSSTLWYSVFCFSDYKLPEGLDELMYGDVDAVFTSGRAEIHTKKTKNYMLTSIASPRTTPILPIKDTSTEYYRTVVMNESFHGTTLFEPGKDGYQQHLMYAALSDRFYTFINLPGAEKDFCGMRPGYWYGNLVFPALKQEGNELFCRYTIPDRVPTKFTHAYFPAYAAEEICEKNGFRFARVGDGYLALWCSTELEMNNADTVVDADLRAYGDDVCWYIRVGSKDHDGSFDSFIDSCLMSNISQEKICKKLSAI